MALEFKVSEPLTFGVELELMVLNTRDYDLARGAADLLGRLDKLKLPGEVKPEITESMIEINSAVCRRHDELLAGLRRIRDAIVTEADKLNLAVAGGGSHPFHRWADRRIFPTERFLKVSNLYGYLAKQFTVFGQHIHIGVAAPDDAVYLTHAFAPYIPHFIALSASSPYSQGQDTSFETSRLHAISAFPLAGQMPAVITWNEFDRYFEEMRGYGIVDSMKDFYWDIRPKPEYGTIEIRVMDTPLTVERAAAIAAYLQCVARWLAKERPFEPQEDDYLAYTYNRFQACRFGLDGEVVDPITAVHRPLRELIRETIDAVEMHAIELHAERGLMLLKDTLSLEHGTDAAWLRAAQERERYLPEVVRQQCLRFEGVAP